MSSVLEVILIVGLTVTSIGALVCAIGLIATVLIENRSKAKKGAK